MTDVRWQRCGGVAPAGSLRCSCPKPRLGTRERSWWKEYLKSRLVKLCAAGLVGGAAHKDYMVQLGMPAERVFLGYDAVDNEYFRTKADEVRSQSSVVRSQLRLPERYFLASARFVEKKNLPRLIEAYARYRTLCEDHRPQDNGTTGQVTKVP